MGFGLDRRHENGSWSVEMKKGHRFKKIYLCALWAFIVLCLPILSSSALAADSVCAEVKLEIRQGAEKWGQALT